MSDALKEQPPATPSMLRLNNPVLFSVERLNTPQLWKWGGGGDYTECGTKGSQVLFFFFHLEPVTARAGGMGELEAKESISQLEH